jgi:hypothetical protein
MGMLYLRRQMQSLAAAEELVDKQFDPLPADLIDGLIDFAEHQGKRDGVLTLLRLIRTEYGRNGVRYGHVYWIMDLLDKDFDPDNISNIPSFRREDATTP